MRSFAKLTLAALTALVLGSCQKQTTYDDPVTPAGPPVQPVQPAPITANLQGTVLDETGNPAPGVTVKVGTASVSTDSRGNFRINGASLDKNQSLVTATKAGYFKAYRSFAATAATNQVVLQLIKRTLTGTVDATTGGSAALSNGSKVTLPGAGIVDAATGAAYTGAVKVYAAYIDPTAASIRMTVPGSFLADDKDGRRTLLTSYGMLAVELEGASGQKLQLKSGAEATLTTAIPTAAQASAPASVPLWYLDETSGIWKEQGTATKTGNTYVGNVPHFTFWNADVANGNMVTLSLTINGPNGGPMPYVRVRLSRSAAYGGTTYGITDSAGHVSGLVPAGEALTLTVFDNCESAVFTQAIGSFTAATTLPAITVTPGGQLTTLSGTLKDCSNNPVAQGIVVVSSGTQNYLFTTNASGVFSGNVLSCSGGGSIIILGADSSYSVQSSQASLPFTAGTMNAGTLSVCNQPTGEYYRAIVDGTTYVWDNSIPGDTTFCWGTGQAIIGGYKWVGGQYRNITMGVNTLPATPGTYPVPGGMEVELPGFIYFSAGQQMTWYNSSNVTVTYTTVATSIGQYVTGTFSGTFSQTTTSPTHTLSGSFRIQRTR